MRTNLLFPLALLSFALMAGCASSPPAQPIMSTQGTTLVQTGQVTNVRDIAIRGGHSTGIGSFLGAILGGVAGSKIGSGTGSAVAGVGGAIAGGMAGQRVEESGISQKSTELTVRFEDGEMRTYRVEPEKGYRIGDMVTVTTRAGVSQVTPLPR